MANVWYYTAKGGENLQSRLLNENRTAPYDPTLDALILDFDPFFPPTFHRVIEVYTKKDIPVFLITGQRGEAEQEQSRKKELEAIALGAIPLGDPKISGVNDGSNHNVRKFQWFDILQHVEQIFDQQGTIEDHIAAVQESLSRPVLERHEFSQMVEWLENGGTIDIGKFVYCNYQLWQNIRQSPKYNPLAQAAETSFIQITLSIAAEMSKRDINDYYSMGPTPQIDAHVLTTFVHAKQQVVYHPIDTNIHAITHTLKVVEKTLEAVSPLWRRYVTLVSEKPQLFNEVSTQKPVCVAYPGGQIVNNPSYFENARRIAQKGGLVVADIHTRTSTNDASSWESIYNTSEQKQMFARALHILYPGIQRQTGWNIVIKYLQSEREGHQENPARISFQFNVQKKIKVTCNALNIPLEPGIVRELMISEKYHPIEIQQQYEQLGYTLQTQHTTPIAGKQGSVATLLLGYDNVHA